MRPPLEATATTTEERRERTALEPAPAGLDRCIVCGELQGICLGESDDGGRNGATGSPRAAIDVRCSCYGYVCRRCGEDTLYRPMSTRWSEREGRLLYVSAVMGLRPCRACGATNAWVPRHPELGGAPGPAH